MSASAGMATLVSVFANAIGLGGLPRQLGQRRQIVVPLNDRRLRPESANRMRIQIPGRLGHRLRMRVHEQRRAGRRLVLLGRETSKMELCDGSRREPIDEL